MDKNLARQAELALERQGDYDSLCYEGRWHSSGQLADRAARLATGLADLGVRPGDRLLVLMANCPEVLITYTAALRAGAVVTPLIFLVSEDELRHALVDSGAVGIVTTVEFLPKVTAAVKGDGGRWVGRPGSGSCWCPGRRRTARMPPGVPVLDFDQVASAEPGSIADRSGTDLAALLYTGGTTGRSKGVPLTHAGLYWCGSAAHEMSVPRQRGQLGAAASPGARLRPAGHLRRHAPDRPGQDHPDALVRSGRLGEAGRGAPGPGQRAGALDDPDAADPAAGESRPVRADRDLVRGRAAGRGGPAGVRGTGADRGHLRGVRVHRGGHVHLGESQGRPPGRQRRPAGAGLSR